MEGASSTSKLRRLQRRRSEAGRVQWLIGMVQAKQSHHTNTGQLWSDITTTLEELRREQHQLRARLAVLEITSRERPEHEEGAEEVEPTKPLDAASPAGGTPRAEVAPNAAGPTTGEDQPEVPEAADGKEEDMEEEVSNGNQGTARQGDAGRDERSAAVPRHLESSTSHEKSELPEARTPETVRAGATPEEYIEKYQKAIAKAKTVEDIKRLQQALKRGDLPEEDEQADMTARGEGAATSDTGWMEHHEAANEEMWQQTSSASWTGWQARGWQWERQAQAPRKKCRHCGKLSRQAASFCGCGKPFKD